MVRLQPDMLDPVDAFAASEADNPSRPEALRRIVRDWLSAHGFLKSE